MSLEKFLDQVEDGVDPRVQVELERLNSATDEINKLEVDLDEARNQFRQLLQESTSQIDSCAKKLGSCIVKVRPYYDARIKAKEALLETQKAAVNFERANSAHAAAKEMVYLAEEGLKTEGRTFDHAWQEMLNHATMRVNESESERTRCEAEHKRTSQNYQLAEIRVRTLQKELKRAITKSRPYFELKIHYSQLLEKQKIKVKNLEKQVTEVKLTYAHTLKNLERISDEIHKTRQKKRLGCKKELGKRSEGVGAESNSSNEFCHLYMKKSKSGSGSAKTLDGLQGDSQTENRRQTAGDDSETGKHPQGTPVSDSCSSKYTLTPNTTISSQPDTDIWSECTDIGNFEASPNSENDSFLTGPPDTESEDEVFNNSEKEQTVQALPDTNKSNNFISHLKGAGDSKLQSDLMRGITEHITVKKNSASFNCENQSNSYFEGVGICSFPVETELNLNFDEKSKSKEESLEIKVNPSSGWTEIKLCSPEEETFSMVKVVNPGKSINQLEEDFDIPYAPLSEPEGDFGSVNQSDKSPSDKKAELVVEKHSEKNGLEKILGKNTKKETAENTEWHARSLKGTPRKLNLRRQSLDVLWNNTAGEKMKEILSQSIMKLNIGSLTERKSGDSKMNDGSDYIEDDNSNNSKAHDSTYESNLTSQFGINFFNRKNSKVEDDLSQSVGGDEKRGSTAQESFSTQIGGFISRKEKFFIKKVPSPLEKTLNYLNADDESNSDSESLASSDMLTDEQLSSLVLDRDLAEIYQDIL